VVGCGKWGREIIQTLSQRPNAPIVGICDTYQPFLTRCQDMAPQAALFTDYRELLARKEVQAVIVATPSHRHKDIVLDALKAGKHVYCEAPIATTMEDARAIARAAQAASRVNFQPGLQNRSDPQLWHLAAFLRTGVLGKLIKVRSQFHKKQMWRITSPNPEREKEANWRLDKAVSLGLMGEIGVHQVDLANWYLGGLPKAVTGFGALVQWTEDGRVMDDNVQAVFEYPEGVLHNEEVTIANSFDSDYEILYGAECAILVRDRQAWMFKEPDAQVAGWEVYARKDTFYKESGIVLGADATKQGAADQKPQAQTPPAPNPALQSTALSFSLQRFLTNSLLVSAGVEDFTTSFGNTDAKALEQYLAGLAKNRQPAATWKDGYDSAVLAIKASEAVARRQRIVLAREWFEIA
jgi:predicted dehydrogenase